MQPDSDSNKKRPSVDGIRQPRINTSPPRPEYRYDHELPPPEAVDKITAVATPDHKDGGKLHRWSWRKKIAIWTGIFMGLIIVLVICLVGWYQQQLTPVSSDTSAHVRVTIESGSAPSAIAKQLKQAGVIRSEIAFAIYTKLSNTQDTLKAGVYNLQPSLSTPAIVDHLVSGKQDTFHITFLPGDTLANNRQKIIELGYNAADVDAALAATYDRPLFAGKPATADLEGYIFGDTYEFDASATVHDILNRTFDEYEAAISENDLVNGFKKQGLTLYQGITLASIVQREVTNATPSVANNDQKQVARVFLNRMAAGMTLGSDVTYQYAAKKMGVDPTPTLDSPYNTRIHTGLPPGPIAVPGVGALVAVANPGVNDYLFFLSGDDNVTYFAKTDAQHQQNVTQHCQKKCLIN